MATTRLDAPHRPRGTLPHPPHVYHAPPHGHRRGGSPIGARWWRAQGLLAHKIRFRENWRNFSFGPANIEQSYSIAFGQRGPFLPRNGARGHRPYQNQHGVAILPIANARTKKCLWRALKFGFGRISWHPMATPRGSCGAPPAPKCPRSLASIGAPIVVE